MRSSRELGVCIATSGLGASHLLTGLYDARMDHMPVLALVGQQARTAIGAHYQQELDLNSMFKDVAGSFVQTAMAPAQIRHLVDRAIRTAVSERVVTALILPNDLQDMPYAEPERAHGFTFSSIGYARPKVEAPTLVMRDERRRDPVFARAAHCSAGHVRSGRERRRGRRRCR